MIKRSNEPDGLVKVTFVLDAVNDERAVSVVADFNSWDPLAHPLRKRSNGTRSVAVNLEAGQAYRFKYLAHGGEWFFESDLEVTGPDDVAPGNSLLEL